MEKKVIERKMLFCYFPYKFSEMFLIIRRTEGFSEVQSQMHISRNVKNPIFLSHINEN